ncbi:MAG TPA: M48 family metalloprotease [Bacteroidota bacterium]|nr:M48 family metalloprotease [Bacteroidota bacterium]
MARSLVCLLTFSQLLLVCAFGQTKEYTQRAKNDVRKGPGNYFELISVLPKGVALEIVKQESGWARIVIADPAVVKSLGDDFRRRDAWISKNCLGKSVASGSLSGAQLALTSAKASPAAVAAAIRGFALRYGRTTSADVDEFLRKQDVTFTPDEYQRFIAEIPKTKFVSPAKRPGAKDEPPVESPYDFTISEQGIGAGIAARVASKGLVEDPELVKYLNLIAAYVVHYSGFYDTQFKVLVIRDAQPNAFAIPGGYVFITEGMLGLCQNEADLAAVIAHEIVHIVARHGLREVEHRRPQIRADEVFGELEEEIGAEEDTVVAELEDYAIEAYETVMKPRLQGYEEESDRGAALLLVRAGYTPTAVPNMVQRIQVAVATNPNIEFENPFAKLDFKKRHTSVMNYLSRLNYRGGVTKEDRFKSIVKR